MLGQALDLALRELESHPAEALARLAAAREQAAVAGRELRELAHGLHPVGLERGLRGALAALARAVAAAAADRRAARRAASPRWSRPRSGSSSRRRSRTRSSTPARPSCASPSSSTGARSSPRSPTTAPAAPARPAGTGLQGLRRASSRSAAGCSVESPPGAGTTLTATIPLAPWRTATEPFLEFGHDDDGGRGRRKIEEILAGTRTTGVSLAREWDLEGGPPRIGQRLPVFDHTGRRHGLRRGRARRRHPVRRGRPERRSIPSPAKPTGTRPRARAYEECREEIAALLGEPDWRLTDAEPMVILTYRLVPAAPISGSIR